jgi:hypothetical protein
MDAVYIALMGPAALFLFVYSAFELHGATRFLGDDVMWNMALRLVLSVAVIYTWIWLWAVAASLLIVARRFDVGFDWFNRHFDIEKKPLQSIGLVAGALVAVAYWMAVIVGRVIG